MGENQYKEELVDTSFLNYGFTEATRHSFGTPDDNSSKLCYTVKIPYSGAYRVDFTGGRQLDGRINPECPDSGKNVFKRQCEKTHGKLGREILDWRTSCFRFCSL